MPEVSIAISAQDDYSQAILTMRNANQAFSKDMDSMQKKLDALNKNKTTVKVDVDKAKDALKEAEKAYKQLGDEANKSELETANANYEQARRNLDLLSKEARKTEREMSGLSDAQSRMSNRAGPANAGIKNMISAFATSGAAQMIGNVAMQGMDTIIGSVLGDAAGNLAGNALNSAVSGAAIGSMLLPGLGTFGGAAVGALGGAAIGAATGGLQNFQKEDDAFKSVVQDRYNTVTGNRQAELQTGIGIAAQRQTDRISFNTLFGDEEVAGEYLEDLKDMANHTPFLYDDLTAMSKTLKVYGYGADDMLPLLTKIGDTGATLGMKPEDMNQVASYLGRMNSTGKTSMEFLDPLMARGIPALDYMAEAFGKSKEDIVTAVSKGLIPGADAAAAIADYMGEASKGAMEIQAGTYSGLLSTQQGLQEELYAREGGGYAKTRSYGIEENNKWLEKQVEVKGEGTISMGDAYEKMGIQRAREDNRRENEKREAIEEMLATEGLDGMNGAQLEELLNLAEAQGINRYEGSAIAQERLESEKQLAKDIAADMVLRDEYWNAGYELGQQLSKGMLAARAEHSAEIFGIIENQQPEKYAGIISPNLPGLGYAYGISNVPENNYPALLHQGERVLTASENRAYSHGSTPEVTITGNNFTVREEADVEKVARSLLDEMIRVRAIS